METTVAYDGFSIMLIIVRGHRGFQRIQLLQLLQSTKK
jgi:hypothetical protein